MNFLAESAYFALPFANKAWIPLVYKTRIAERHSSKELTIATYSSISSSPLFSGRSVLVELKRERVSLIEGVDITLPSERDGKSECKSATE
jgi:hypothetical protein